MGLWEEAKDLPATVVDHPFYAIAERAYSGIVEDESELAAVAAIKTAEAIDSYRQAVEKFDMDPESARAFALDSIMPDSDNTPDEEDLQSFEQEAAAVAMDFLAVASERMGEDFQKLSFDESKHARDSSGRFAKGYRVHRKAFTKDDLHDRHESRPWIDSGDDAKDRPRRGMSVSGSLDELADYFAGGIGTSIGRGASLRDAHLAELEGDESGDDPFEPENEKLIHPKRLISSTPVEKHPFFGQLKEKINSRFGDRIPVGQEYDYVPELDDWLPVESKTKLPAKLYDWVTDHDWDLDGEPEESAEDVKETTREIFSAWDETPELRRQSRLTESEIEILRKFANS